MPTRCKQGCYGSLVVGGACICAISGKTRGSHMKRLLVRCRFAVQTPYAFGGSGCSDALLALVGSHPDAELVLLAAQLAAFAINRDDSLLHKQDVLRDVAELSKRVIGASIRAEGLFWALMAPGTPELGGWCSTLSAALLKSARLLSGYAPVGRQRTGRRLPEAAPSVFAAASDLAVACSAGLRCYALMADGMGDEPQLLCARLLESLTMFCSYDATALTRLLVTCQPSQIPLPKLRSGLIKVCVGVKAAVDLVLALAAATDGSPARVSQRLVCAACGAPAALLGTASCVKIPLKCMHSVLTKMVCSVSGGCPWACPAVGSLSGDCRWPCHAVSTWHSS